MRSGCAEVPLGSLMHTEVAAEEEVTYVAWEKAKLLERLDSTLNHGVFQYISM